MILSPRPRLHVAQALDAYASYLEQARATDASLFREAALLLRQTPEGEPRWQPFNLNDRVRVKLTPHGKDVFARYWKRLDLSAPPVAETNDGWSHWQLHDLMGVFGRAVGMGLTLPFETAIEFEIQPAPPASTPGDQG